MIDLSTYFTSLVAMASAVTLITGWLKTNVKFLNNVNGTWAQVMSWVVSIALAFVGAQKGVGLFVDSSLVNTVLNGIAVGLVANGIFAVDFVQSLLVFVKAKKPAA